MIAQDCAYKSKVCQWSSCGGLCSPSSIACFGSMKPDQLVYISVLSTCHQFFWNLLRKSMQKSCLMNENASIAYIPSLPSNSSCSEPTLPLLLNWNAKEIFDWMIAIGAFFNPRAFMKFAYPFFWQPNAKEGHFFVLLSMVALQTLSFLGKSGIVEFMVMGIYLN